MIEFVSKQEIDIVIIIETNLKWTTLTESIMMNKMKNLGKGTEFSFADSKAHKTIKSNWL